MSINIKNFNDDFYKYVNKIISDIHDNKSISDKLFKCKYLSLLYNERYTDKYPLTICLGGSGYIQYNKIFNKHNLNVNINDYNINSLDYDITFSLIDKDIIENSNLSDKFINTIISICKNTLKEYKYNDYTNKIFTYKSEINDNRIYISINCSIFKDHVLELSFWLNGKISDNFTINNFNKHSLYIYEKTDKINYYLLPLDLLVKTTLYAIVDFYEKRKFDKCIKHLNRIKYIKTVYNNYKYNENITLDLILKEFDKKIKNKYEMIYDYPYILAYGYVKNNITDHKIIDCIYKKIRKSNRDNIINIIDKYKKECEESNYNIETELNLN
jgi:hypothetical protein